MNMSPEEEEEVRSVLSRHQERIIADLIGTDLIAVLVKNAVLTSSQEDLLKCAKGRKLSNGSRSDDNSQSSTPCGSEVISENLNNIDSASVKLKCANLIDIIAQNGFEKFKQFCYAIENECPQLIEDLINDRLKSDSTNENINSNEEKIAKDQNDHGEKDIDRTRRATSYTGTTTLPKAAPRRLSLMKEPPPPPPQHNTSSIDLSAIKPAPSPIPSKFPQTEFNLISQKIEQSLINQGYYQSPSTVSSNYSSLLCHASSASSPVVVRKREKLLHRFSDAATLGRKLKKKKNTNRTCYSMTEAIEMLADPVVEDDVFGDRTSWEYHTVSVTRVPGYGFGIAVSGGRDNPHFANGDPSIAVSDVLKGGPAEDRLQVNDRIITVNGVSLENVEYATAVQVLRDSGNTVTLVVKRRVALPPVHQHSHSLSSVGLNTTGGNVGSGLGPANNGMISPGPLSPVISNNNIVPGQPIKVMLSKSSKKEDFGIVLGCRLFIKEISTKARDQLVANGYSLQEGDVITRIHNTNCSDTMSMKEAKKIIDGCKERLNLVVLRDITNQAAVPVNNNLNNAISQSNIYSHAQQVSNCSNNLDDPYLNANGAGGYSSQNLYVQPPTRTTNGPSSGGAVLGDEKNRPSTPPSAAAGRRTDEAPRPPPPRGGGEDFYSSRRQLYEDDPLQRSRQSAEPRFISFQKEGSVGIRLTGGNEAGIFVTAVQPGSPASLQGLTPGDKILKVNDMDMHGVTREEAVLFLLSLQDRIDLIVQYCKEEYEEVVANQRGDSFHIKTHFHCENPSKGEMAFKAGDVFRVTDTLHNGVVGSWQVLKIGRGHQEMQRGVIPNKSRAEELATAQFNATKKEMNASESRGNFFRRRRSTHRRSKSLSRENWDDVVFSDSISKFPAYERVVLRHPGFVRPVVLFGPVSDIAREKLTKDFPDKFTVPLQEDDKANAKCRIVRLSNIRDIMDRGKHALLDITPNAVDRLNYAQFYPIVIFLKTDSKHVIKQLRQGIPKSAHKSSKKLLDQCQKLDRVWSHIFSTTIVLNDTDSWYRKLREAVDLQQSGAVWMSESKPVESLSDDFLFPMSTSRLSYASSPESDLEMSPGPSTSLSLGNLPQLVKASSDPSIATNQDNLDRDREIIGEGLPPPYTHPFDHSNPPQTRRPTMDNSKYTYPPGTPSQTATHDNSTPRPQSLYGIHAPDLPPRVDRGSKPPGGSSGGGTPSRNSSTGGTLGRSAQERLFGKTSSAEDNNQDEYVTRKPNTDSMERTQQNSLDRQRIMSNAIGSPAAKQGALQLQNGSYDSVSSYDSYNTNQMSVQNVRLGPNAPDDLKSVPSANGRPPPPAAVGPNAVDYRPVQHHEHHASRGFMGPNDLNRQNSPGRQPPYHEMSQMRNIDPRSAGMHAPQRPSNLGLEGSPRKQVLETKTDYGKYSRNNSASQADYTKLPKSPHVVPPPNVPNGNGMPSNNGGGAPFKPVPPPKPKNYRPPIQGGGQWENGEPSSPRSPNGFFYPPTPSHYHHSQNAPPPHNPNGNGPPQPPMHPYGNHYNPGQQPGQQPGYQPSNGYNGSGNQYGGGAGGGQPQYMHRGHPPPIANHMQHPSERHALDLAGSREQRGSAFELYRKPQIGAAGHHHNMSEMEPYDERYYQNYQNAQLHHQSRSMYANTAMQAPPQPPPLDYGNYYANGGPSLPLPKIKKKSVLKSPLTALKNAIIKTTRPLRRMNSMVEPERKLKPCLRRQHSMMERHMGRLQYPDEYNTYPAAPQPPADYPRRQRHPSQRSDHDQYYPREQDMNSTYQNLENDDIYGTTGRRSYHDQQAYDYDDIYSNRASIDLERRQTGGKRIIRRHSMADRVSRRPQMVPNHNKYSPEDMYQTRQGAYMMDGPRRPPNSEIMSRRHFYNHDENAEEPIYQSRREMHRNHLYQSKKEMQERIAQGKKEIEREFSPPSSSPSERDDRSDRESIYQSRREVARSQLREQIYQSRREAMDSMAEPIYVSKRDVGRPEPIYESKEECPLFVPENKTDETIEEKAPESSYSSPEESLSNSKQSCDLQRSNDTVIENMNSTQADCEQSTMEEQLTVIEQKPAIVAEIHPVPAPSPKLEVPLTPRSIRAPYHLSNILKRTAPPPGVMGINASRTSIETQYTSQASLPVGPPNATSTPYASDLSLPIAGPVGVPPPSSTFPVFPSEPNTTKGVFDEAGGTLCDNVWNVSLQIPPGAIPPGVKQEIYFTVSDPRMGQAAGGPPLDMENGETMLSPLVMCGPQGLEFNVPVTLNIPHCAGRTASLGLSLKATDSEKNLHTEWDNIDLPSNAAAHTVSVKVDHF